MNTKEQIILDKKNKKKKMLISIIIISILAVVSYVLLENPEIFEKEQEKISVTSMYSDKLYSYNFYEADYDRDVTADEWYMQLDRNMHYKVGNLSIMLLPEDIETRNDAVKFFDKYFKTIVAGDVETYNTYFTDEYYKIYAPYELFSPQMIYNIEIEQLSETSNPDGTTNWTFNVTYMIHKNDGTFRNDLDSDSSKTLYYELIEDAKGDVKINYITYYKR